MNPEWQVQSALTNVTGADIRYLQSPRRLLAPRVSPDLDAL